jgi:peptidoglycan hydrolase-like protein with peptidoglycan-binding domain
MTIKERQCLLYVLGYYRGQIDGIWGGISEQAAERFQQDVGLAVTGSCTEETDAAMKKAVHLGLEKKTGSFWDDIQYFTREEFRCQCGGRYCGGFPAEPEEKLVRTVDEIRRRLGVPVTIVEAGGSGVRCQKHNAAVGGVANSEHLYGRAADLHASVSPARMKAVAEEVMGQSGGIGLYSWGIHVDTGKYSRWTG